VRPQMFKPTLRLRDVGPMTRWHPPHDEVRPLQRLEPFRSATVDTLVDRLPDETFQRVDRFPHGHVQEHARIVAGMAGALPVSSWSRHTKPGVCSAIALTRSRLLTKSAMRGSSSG